MKTPIFGYDRDNDSDVDFQDLPSSQRRDFSDPDGDEGTHWNDPVEDPRGNLRELKRLQAADALEEKRMREEERRNDTIIEAERKVQYDEAHPYRAKIREGARGLADRAGQELRQYDNSRQQQPQRQQRPVQRGYGARPVQRRQAPERGQRFGDNHPHGLRANDRFEGMNQGMKSFGFSVLGGSGVSSGSRGPAPSPRPMGINAGGDHLKMFTHSLLGGSSIPAPVRQQTVTPAPTPRAAPDLNSLFGIGGGGGLKGIGLTGTTEKKTEKSKKKKLGISPIRLI